VTHDDKAFRVALLRQVLDDPFDCVRGVLGGVGIGGYGDDAVVRNDGEEATGGEESADVAVDEVVWWGEDAVAGVEAAAIMENEDWGFGGCSRGGRIIDVKLDNNFVK
jgi:hypothetical protein